MKNIPCDKLHLAVENVVRRVQGVVQEDDGHIVCGWNPCRGCESGE